MYMYCLKKKKKLTKDDIDEKKETTTAFLAIFTKRANTSGAGSKLKYYWSMKACGENELKFTCTFTECIFYTSVLINRNFVWN